MRTEHATIDRPTSARHLAEITAVRKLSVSRVSCSRCSARATTIRGGDPKPYCRRCANRTPDVGRSIAMLKRKLNLAVLS